MKTNLLNQFNKKILSNINSPKIILSIYQQLK